MSDIVDNAINAANFLINFMITFTALILPLALLSSYRSVRKSVNEGNITRVKSSNEALEEILSSNGYVLITVDPSKCGYCKVAKALLDVKGIKYKEVDITNLDEEELEELVEELGIESAPVLLYAHDGKVQIVYHFKGDIDKDKGEVRKIKKVRTIEAIA